MRCLDQPSQLGSGAEANMHGLSLVSPTSIHAFKTGRPKGKKVLLPDLHCTKSVAVGRFHSCMVQSQSRSKVSIDNVPRSNALSTSSQSCLSYSGSCNLISDGCNVISSCDDSTIQKPAKRSKKRKTRREKRNKKISSYACSTNSQGLVAHGSLTSETRGNDSENKLKSGATSPEVSSSDGSINAGDFDGRINHINRPQVSRPSVSSINQVAILGNTMSSALQSLVGERFETHSEARTPKIDQGFSNLDRCLVETDGAEIHCFDHIQAKVLSVDGPDFLLSDSVSVNLSSNDTTDIENDVKSFDINGSCPEPSDLLSQKGYLHKKWLSHGYTGINENSEFRRHGTKVSNSGDVQSPLPGRQSKQIRSPPLGSSVYKSVNTKKVSVRVGKENSRSVWQRVQRTCVDESSSEQKKAPARTQFKIRSKVALPSETNNGHLEVNGESRKEVNGQRKEDISKRLRKNCNLCLEEVGTKGEPSNANVKSAHVPESRQHNGIQHERDRLQNISDASLNLDSSLNLQCVVDADSVEHRESACNNLFNTNIDHEVIQETCLSKPSHVGESTMLKVPSSLNLPDKVPQIEKEATLSGYIKQNHSSGSVTKKWVPIVSMHPGFARSERISSSYDHDHSVADNGWTLKNASEEKLEYSSQDLVSSINHGKNLACGNEEACIQHSFPNLQQFDKQVALTCLSCESKNQFLSAPEAVSSKLIQAINAAYKVELESEAVRASTGGPIAEFEKVLHYCSPVICESPSSLCCQNCFRIQETGMTLCKHEIPDVKLGCLWHWYEEHGSYGLEVRAEDYQKPKRLGIDRFSFRAYFVPYLSAIQLFGSRRVQSIDNRNGVSSPRVSEKHQINEMTLESNGSCPSESSVSKPQISTTTPTMEITPSDDVELLFEYFESDQPQQRRPLYEKIQELVRGDGSSGGKMFGDPTTLVSWNLQDLHPISWYSVAWYPIYKIPDGKFRAAFLTYHSLGHLVSRSTQFDSRSIDSWVVSPAVGLQSYNAQGECWFQLRHNVVIQSEQIHNLNPSGILKERLRTLEVTASLMARAMVNKGDKTSVNKHPDYEFFLARRRYSN